MIKRTYLNYWHGLQTMVEKEVRRFMEFWIDTLLPPIITMALYLLVFGKFLQPQVAHMGGYSYEQYIVPGLIMMSVITGAYANVAFSFFTSKFFHSIDDLLVSPMPNWLILVGYMLGGIMRGLCVATLLTLTAAIFTHLQVQHFLLMVVAVVFSAAVFSLAGFVNGMYARSFDQIGLVPTFFLTPLAFLGGVFFSIRLLSPFWQKMSLFNPILYFINLFRYGMLGVTDVNIGVAIVLLCLLLLILFSVALFLLKRGVGIKA